MEPQPGGKTLSFFQQSPHDHLTGNCNYRSNGTQGAQYSCRYISHGPNEWRAAAAATCLWDRALSGRRDLSRSVPSMPAGSLASCLGRSGCSVGSTANCKKYSLIRCAHPRQDNNRSTLQLSTKCHADIIQTTTSDNKEKGPCIKMLL